MKKIIKYITVYYKIYKLRIRIKEYNEQISLAILEDNRPEFVDFIKKTYKIAIGHYINEIQQLKDSLNK